MISMICAASQNGVIGVDNRLPWRLPADMKFFKTTTLGHPIIMGRKTYESIGRPLPGRTNIVVSRQPNYQAQGCLVADSLEQALTLGQPDDEIFIIGGAVIYQQGLAIADKIYLTIIHQDFAGDTFLFDIDDTLWQESSRTDYTPDDKNPWPYSFITLEKKWTDGIEASQRPRIIAVTADLVAAGRDSYLAYGTYGMDDFISNPVQILMTAGLTVPMFYKWLW